jgi:DNA-binding transcriptional ArsR family regulator
MSSDQVESDGIEARRVKLAVMGDPVVRSIVDRLCLEPATAGEIAEELDLPAPTIRRHLRRLTRYGLVERCGRTQRRGVSENLYECDPRRTVLWSREASGLPGQKIDEADVRLLKVLFREVTKAIEAGSYDIRVASAAVRFPLPLDDAGLKEAITIHDELLDSVIAVVADAKGRLAGESEECFDACAALLFFETPSSGWRERTGDRDRSSAADRWSRNGHPVDTLAIIADAMRVGIIDTLSLDTASATELAARIEMPVEKVRYELLQLERVGAVKVHSRRPRRGTLEKVYICANRNLVMSAEEVSTYTGGRLARYRRHLVARMFRAALGAIGSEEVGSYVDSHLARVPMRVDAQGFTEISELIDVALERLFVLREQCLERSMADGSRLRPSFSGLLLFERPPSESTGRSVSNERAG